MDKVKKKYTFEDWLQGNFPDQPLIVLSKLNNLISDDTVSKIRQAQREAWDKALEMDVSARKESAENRLADVPHPDLWLQKEIQKIEAFVTDNPDIEQKYSAGDVHISGIQGSRYKRINELYEGFKKGHMCYVGIDRNVNGTPQPSQLFRMYIYKEYLPFLKELRDDFDNEADEKKSSNSDTLYLAKDWLHDLGRDIVAIDNPTHQQILNRIQKDFSSFKKVPNEPNIKFTKGLNNINKTSIDKALTYLFNQKYDKTIKTGAIKKRFSEYNIW